MKKALLLCVSVVIMATLLITGCSSLRGGGESIGTVNGKPISKTQYELQYKQNKSYMEQFGLSFESEDGKAMLAQIEEMAWEYAVGNALLVQVAQESGIKVSDSEAKKLLEESIETSFSDQAAYEQWLIDNEMTEQQVMEIFRLQQYNKLLYEQVTKDITVTEEEAKAAYEKDPSAYDNKSTSHILIMAQEGTATEAEKAAAKKEAQDIIKQLNKGGDFAELAKKYSDDTSASEGGVIAQSFTIQETGFYSEYVQEAFRLKGVGSYSQVPVKTDAGYHIIKIDAEKIGFAAVKEEMMNNLATEKKSQAYSDFIKSKRDAAKILRETTFEYWIEGNKLYAPVAGYKDVVKNTATDNQAATDNTKTDNTKTDNTKTDNTKTDQ
ncbi:MAG: peptidylprolyl isomerase [Bacillota bacterium]